MLPAARRSLGVPLLAAALGLLVAARLVALRSPADGSRLPTGLDVLLVTLSSARADALPSSAPAIARFVDGALPFDTFLAQGTWTIPSLASVYTGQHPRTHGAGEREGGLPEAAPTLAARLRDAGYATAAFLGEYGLPPGSGLDRGFDVVLSQPGDGAAVDRALEWVEALPDGRRMLLHVHLGGLSVPYAPASADPAYDGPLAALALDQDFIERTAFGRHHPAPGPGGEPAVPIELGPRDAEHVARRYRAQVPEVDAAFDRLRAGVDRLRPRRLTVLVGLHGDGLGERGFVGPGYGPYEEVVRVPMAVDLPDGAVTVARAAGAAEGIDVAPTVLDVVDVEVPAAMEGRSLVPVIEGWVPGGLSEMQVLGSGSAVAARTPRWKLIRRLEAGPGPRETWELYNLEEDPGERWNLYRRDTPLGPVGTRLGAALRAFLAAGPGEPAPATPLSREAEERIRRRVAGER